MEEGPMTMREIDMFENRLQLKTLQEGLKHKVASVDITPKLVYDAVNGGINDYNAKFGGKGSESMPSSLNELSSREESSFYSQDTDDDQDKLPVIYPPEPAPPPPPQVKVKARQLVLNMMHASTLEASECYWKSGKTVPNSRNPIINEVIHLYAPLSGPLGSITISVFSQEDKDGHATDTLIGSGSVNVDKALEEEEAKAKSASCLQEPGPLHLWVDLKGGRSGSIHISLQLEIVPE